MFVMFYAENAQIMQTEMFQIQELSANNLDIYRKYILMVLICL